MVKMIIEISTKKQIFTAIFLFALNHIEKQGFSAMNKLELSRFLSL